MAQMRRKFQQLDANGDGTLDFKELADMLVKGNSSFTNDECMALYDSCDTNGDGKISFEEFLEYVYNGAHQQPVGNSDDRHARLHAQSNPTNDGTEVDWRQCEYTFREFAGDDMDGREFMKFCKDSKLIANKGFTKTDVDLVFSKVMAIANVGSKGNAKRRMDFSAFQDACRLIAAKRGCSNKEVQDLVSDSNGPKLKGTKAEATRFHDDKSTYTGAHAHNDKIAGCDPNAAVGRHEAMAERKESELAALEETEDAWDECLRVFEAFAGDSGDLDGKEFYDMCLHISGLQRGGFAKGDIDVIFSSCCDKGQRRIMFPQFQKCVRKIAQKKDEDVSSTQACVARSRGPTLHGTTKADYVKFHDDKKQYTGASAHAA